MSKGGSKKAEVGLVMGSASDAEVMRGAKLVLDEFGVSSELRILSAHRTPEETFRWAQEAEDNGFRVIIAAAGMAAHLAGVISANTHLPVIGVPIASGSLAGVDALLSTVQMPTGTPVATMGIGRSGAVNAALLAVRILAAEDRELRDRLRSYRRERVSEIAEADKKIREGAGA